jgi:beta-lactamase class D
MNQPARYDSGPTRTGNVRYRRRNRSTIHDELAGQDFDPYYRPMSSPLASLLTIIATLSLLSGSETSRAQPIRFPTIEAEFDAVVLVADARSGRLLGGVRTAEAFRRDYYPASLFKLAIAVSALASGHFDPSFSYTCHGTDTIAGTVEWCWLHSGHGRLSFDEALAQSCNLYFRTLAERLTSQEMIGTARALGLRGNSGFPGDPTASDGPIDLGRPVLLGEAFRVSPAQMLRTALVLASHGRLAHSPFRLFGRRFKPLYDGLTLCTRTGTGRAAWSRRFVVAGKTGTAPIDGIPNRTVGWFIGYAPAARPKYAVSVLLRGGKGSDAALVARRVLEELL